MFGQQPILVLSQNTKRESGRKVQIENINAGKTIADVIRTCLGPQAMLKMLMDPMGGIVMTNDGNAILREITVQHPAAKFMIEIARTQDEEVGDGTTSVIVLAGEMLAVAEQFLAQNIHPTVIIREYRQALEDAVKLLQDKISVPIDMNDKEKMKEVKIPGGTLEESRVLNGVMINKDVTHPKMRRQIDNPRIILLDCPLEYKKGESQTNIEIVGEQELRESDVGTLAGKFEVKKIGDEYFTFIIPRTLAQNCGANTIRTLTALRARHASGAGSAAGIDGETGEIVDMAVYKTAVETAILLLRIDDIVSGSKKKSNDAAAPPPPAAMAGMETTAMMTSFNFFLCCLVLIRNACSIEVQHGYETHSEVNVETDMTRGRRGVIEEEKFYNIRTENQAAPWMPGPPEDPTTKISITNEEVKEVLPLYQTTERVTDKPTGRGARASNENWIKLPYPGHEENSRDDILSPPQPSGELINSRMPRVNFVTQNKPLEASESRNDKESIQRVTRTDDVRDIRTDFVRPGEDDRSKLYKPVYPRQAVYYPEESRRPYYVDRYYPADELYRRDPYYDPYDRRRYTPGFPAYGPKVDRYDEINDNYVPRKPKRIIYYTHLPEVVRTPPSVDLRYRYSADPYRRFDDDYYARTGRYDYRFRNKYPYAPLRKEERNYRDLAGAGTANKDKKVEEKVTPTPILPEKEDKYKKAAEFNRNANRNLINSHQYHDGVVVSYNEPVSHKGYQDVVRPDDSYLRYDEPLFQGAVEDPYQRKY
ncbi:hypothetical protein MSG28_012248 [Choristoneura fumiferana]|uniref:Uncharacterized protein n=1 Tax=Choristoneura fumiferana TaxID=7141 RepID=A0ACC0KD39_CHOFU|nr:hypothetical protein MSG28_012248 [Choristoneura fumiferana]